MLNSNNILSYFIKDIKDPKECSLYKQINTNTNNIEIFYKDKVLYRLLYYRCKPEISCNYKNNIIKEYYPGRITNYKIDSIKQNNYKALFYKKDKIISKINGNYILCEFIYNKYFIIKYLDYLAEFISLLYIKIKYYNRYIYKYICISIYKTIYNRNNKYKHVQILIINKYELHYINRFFNLFFVNIYN
jgi:hypothetical protein